MNNIFIRRMSATATTMTMFLSSSAFVENTSFSAEFFNISSTLLSFHSLSFRCLLFVSAYLLCFSLRSVSFVSVHLLIHSLRLVTVFFFSFYFLLLFLSFLFSFSGCCWFFFFFDFIVSYSVVFDASLDASRACYFLSLCSPPQRSKFFIYLTQSRFNRVEFKLTCGKRQVSDAFVLFTHAIVALIFISVRLKCMFVCAHTRANVCAQVVCICREIRLEIMFAFARFFFFLRCGDRIAFFAFFWLLRPSGRLEMKHH